MFTFLGRNALRPPSRTRVATRLLPIVVRHAQQSTGFNTKADERVFIAKYKRRHRHRRGEWTSRKVGDMTPDAQLKWMTERYLSLTGQVSPRARE